MRTLPRISFLVLVCGLLAPADVSARRDEPQHREVPPPAAQPCPDQRGTAAGLQGEYLVSGRNPDGTRYSGTATIRSDPSGSFRVAWEIGSDQFSGTGRFAGNTLTVDWGTDAPAVYELKTSGLLAGTWAHGEGTEWLTPAGAASCQSP